MVKLEMNAQAMVWGFGINYGYHGIQKSLEKNDRRNIEQMFRLGQYEGYSFNLQWKIAGLITNKIKQAVEYLEQLREKTK